MTISLTSVNNLYRVCFSQLTLVRFTPQSSGGGVAAGAAGVSMNSKSSEDSEWVLAMVLRRIEES
jgi:hypothetical protein